MCVVRASVGCLVCNDVCLLFRKKKAADLSGQLKAGDLIYLTLAGNDTDNSNGGFLTAEGYCDARVGLTPVASAVAPEAQPRRFERCLFRVVQKLSYEASKTHVKMQRKASITADQIQAMMEKVEKEEIQNDNLTKVSITNQSIKYGQIIQLQHVNSNKFLSMKRATQARLEKGNYMLELAQGSEMAWFAFKPRYKIRSEGGPVYIHDQILLVNTKMSEGNTDHHVHVSASQFSKAEDAEEKYEANLAAIGQYTSAWRLNGYLTGLDGGLRDKLIKYGDMVRMYHPESESFLAGTCNTNRIKLPYLNHTTFKDPNHAGNMRTKAVFVLEGAKRSLGGCVIAGAPVRFRHHATGRYLTINYDASLMPMDVLQTSAMEGKMSIMDEDGNFVRYTSRHIYKYKKNNTGNHHHMREILSFLSI